ncbi:MAG TPA: zf-HC2 domain-containing protein [Thermoanaerobaculia bacterium]|nr:zf-HC2 domain-containing protein [Thermoanaerobaculia bacterium]
MTNATDFKDELKAVADGESWGATDWDPRRGEHPGDDLLVAYGTGHLDDGEQARVQDHLTTCSQCRALVADLCAFPDLEEIDGEPSEFEVAAAWRGVSERLAAEDREERRASGGEPIPPKPANDHRPFWKNVSVAWTVAAALAFAFLSSNVWNLQERSSLYDDLAHTQGALTAASQPRTGAISDSNPELRNGADGVARCVVSKDCNVWVAPSVEALAVGASDLRLVVVDAASGTELWHSGLDETASEELESAERGFLFTYPAAAMLEPGSYEIRLHATGAADEVLHTERFEVTGRSAAAADGRR